MVIFAPKKHCLGLGTCNCSHLLFIFAASKIPSFPWIYSAPKLPLLDPYFMFFFFKCLFLPFSASNPSLCVCRLHFLPPKWTFPFSGPRWNLCSPERRKFEFLTPKCYSFFLALRRRFWTKILILRPKKVFLFYRKYWYLKGQICSQNGGLAPNLHFSTPKFATFTFKYSFPP